MAAPKLNVKTGDTVVVISGKDKGKEGKITRAFPKDGKIIVDGVAMVKKHQKPRGQGMPGGIIDQEAAIHGLQGHAGLPEVQARRPASLTSSWWSRARRPRRSARARSAARPLITEREGGN